MSNPTFFPLTKIMLLSFVIWLAGCATGPEIYSLYDRGSDFSVYKSYAFIDPLSTEDGQYSSFVTTYLKSAISSEMESLGYVESEDPDVLINFFINTAERAEVTTTSVPTRPSSSIGVSYGTGYGGYGYYSYRYGYNSWAEYETETRVSQYREGTLNIDLIDASKEQLVWEGVAIGRIPDDVLDDLEYKVSEVVEQVFESYPLQSGD